MTVASVQVVDETEVSPGRFSVTLRVTLDGRFGDAVVFAIYDGSHYDLDSDEGWPTSEDAYSGLGDGLVYDDVSFDSGSVVERSTVLPAGDYLYVVAELDSFNNDALDQPVRGVFSLQSEAPAVPEGDTTITSIAPGVRSAIVSWTYNNNDQTGFTVQLGTDDPIDVGDVTEYELAGLTPDASYDPGVRITPYNDAGDGGSSPYVVFSTWFDFQGSDDFSHPNYAHYLPPWWETAHNVRVLDGVLGTAGSGLGYVRLGTLGTHDYGATVDIIGTETPGVLLRSAGAGAALRGYACLCLENEVSVYKVVAGSLGSPIGTITLDEDTGPYTVDIVTVGSVVHISAAGGDADVVDSSDPYLDGELGLIALQPSTSIDGITAAEFRGGEPSPRVVYVPHAISPPTGIIAPAADDPYQPPVGTNLVLTWAVNEHTNTFYFPGTAWNDVPLVAIGEQFTGYMGPFVEFSPLGDTSIVWNMLWDPPRDDQYVLRILQGANGTGHDYGALSAFWVAGAGHIRHVYTTTLDEWMTPVDVGEEVTAVVPTQPGDLVVDFFTLFLEDSMTTPFPDLIFAGEGQIGHQEVTVSTNSDDGYGNLRNQLAWGASSKRATGKSTSMSWDTSAIDTDGTGARLAYVAHRIYVISPDPAPIHTPGWVPSATGGAATVTSVVESGRWAVVARDEPWIASANHHASQYDPQRVIAAVHAHLAEEAQDDEHIFAVAVSTIAEAGGQMGGEIEFGELEQAHLAYAYIDGEGVVSVLAGSVGVGRSDESVSGDGHQTSYGAGKAAQNQPVIGSGYQTSYGLGAAAAIALIAVTGAGYQGSYGTGSVNVLQPASASGYQTSHGEGSVAQSQPANGSAHQVAYGTGAVAQAQPATGDGHQASYGSGSVDIAGVIRAAGSGYQSSYGSGAVSQSQPIEGAGYQASYGAGAASVIGFAQVSGDGHQWSYGGGIAAQLQPATGAGHQGSYGAGDAHAVQPGESPVRGAGYQQSYGTGWVSQSQPISGGGHQWSYGSGQTALSVPASGSGYQSSYGSGRAVSAILPRPIVRPGVVIESPVYDIIIES